MKMVLWIHVSGLIFLNEVTVLYLNSPFVLGLSFGAGEVCPLGGSKTLSVTFTVILLFLSATAALI